MIEPGPVAAAIKRQRAIVRCAKPRCPHGLLLDFGPDVMSSPEWAARRFDAERWGHRPWRLSYSKLPEPIRVYGRGPVVGLWAVYCPHHSPLALLVAGDRRDPFALRCAWPGCETVALLPWSEWADEYDVANQIPGPCTFAYVLVQPSPMLAKLPACGMLCEVHGAKGADDALAPTNKAIDA